MGRWSEKLKPVGILYGVDESPPWLTTLFNAVQHVGLTALFLIFPLVVFRVGEIAHVLVANLLSTAMLAMESARFCSRCVLGRSARDT